jgi:hypothetical protein
LLGGPRKVDARIRRSRGRLLLNRKRAPSHSPANPLPLSVCRAAPDAVVIGVGVTEGELEALMANVAAGTDALGRGSAPAVAALREEQPVGLGEREIGAAGVEMPPELDSLVWVVAISLALHPTEKARDEGKDFADEPGRG